VIRGGALEPPTLRADALRYHDICGAFGIEPAIGRPELRTKSSASLRNLSLYLLGRAMTAPFYTGTRSYSGVQETGSTSALPQPNHHELIDELEPDRWDVDDLCGMKAAHVHGRPGDRDGALTR